MIAPAEADIGRRVIYHPARGHTVEEGVISSSNPAYVFIRYGADAGSKATPREALEWFGPHHARDAGPKERGGGDAA